MPAERWQQWMPFHIDRFRGSLHVQGMPGCARAGYLYLLASAWQSADCSLPNDNVELQILSGLTLKEWTQYKPIILRRFTVVNDSLVNDVLRSEWEHARTKHEENHKARSEAGKKGAAKRWDGKAIAEPCDGYSTPMAKNGNNTVTSTSTETKAKNKQQPSRDKRESDPRHESFKAAVTAYAAFKHVKLPWDGSDAKQLALLLSSAPDLTLKEFQECLNHRARSPGTAHGERPRLWLPHVLKYQQGPLNTYNRTEEANGKPEYAKNKAERTLDALTQAIHRGNSSRVSQAGDFASGPVITAGTGTLRNGAAELGDGGPPGGPEILAAAPQRW